MRVRAALIVASCCLLTTLAAQPRLSQQDADRFRTKLTRIVDYGNTAPVRAATPRSTPLTDAEVNSYLKFHAASEIPAGIIDPLLTALGGGRISGRAIVDLDAVRTQKARGWLDPAGYLTGRLPVTAVGRLAAKDGIGRFELESAEISGITVPKAVLQELLSYYSRSPEQPSGIDMDDPFALPARIREIRVGTGSATVVQ
jgi:hypothetical protein